MQHLIEVNYAKICIHDIDFVSLPTVVTSE